MPNFRYRAITQNGEVVSGSLSAPTAAEVARRIEYLGLVPVETVVEDGVAEVSRATIALFNQPRPEDVTVFTRDLALLLKAGARLDDALELLASDTDIGRLHPVVAKIRAGILAGESFAEAAGKHPMLFPPIYIALVQVGETSGKLSQILELISAERARAEALRRRLTDALQYPAFVLLAAMCVLTFFILFVLPQFSSVLRDFGAKGDSAITTFLSFSDFVRGNATELVIAATVTKQLSEPAHKASYCPASTSTRVIPANIFSTLASSCSRCFLPASVTLKIRTGRFLAERPISVSSQPAFNIRCKAGYRDPSSICR